MPTSRCDSYSIGAMAEATATKVETVRYYERIGLLLEPGRTSGKYRSYSADHLGRLSFIRRARDLGFILDQIRAAGTSRSQEQRLLPVASSAHSRRADPR